MLIALLGTLALAPVFWLAVPAAWRPWTMTIGSLVVLGCYDPRLAGVVLAGATALFVSLQAMNERSPAVRGVIATVAIVVFAAVFAWNKLAATGGGAVSSQEGLVFLGVSYLVLKASAVVIDRARGAVSPVSYGDLLRWLVFLPTYTSGPIEELDHFRRQTPEASAERIGRGLERVILGLVKAIVVSRALAIWAEPLLAAPEECSRFMLLLATYAFTLRFYLDFAGYSDIAIGTAAVFGYVIQENFDRPLIRRNLVLLWQGWHMTLTRWLRTYVFVPVSRGILRRSGGRWDLLAVMIAQLVTMLVCGLWHGITWGFALWGVVQAAGLIWVGIAARRIARWLPAAVVGIWRTHPAALACSIALTFNVFSMSNVLVYSTLDQALRIYRALLGVA